MRMYLLNLLYVANWLHHIITSKWSLICSSLTLLTVVSCSQESREVLLESAATPPLTKVIPIGHVKANDSAHYVLLLPGPWPQGGNVSSLLDITPPHPSHGSHPEMTPSNDNNGPSSTGQLMCETWWDGLYQWPATLANTTISIECHEIFATQVLDVDQQYALMKHYANRKCLLTGQWGWGNWTNYTECLNLLSQQEKDTSAVNQVQEIVSYIVLIFLIASLVSLILSIVIFITFKPLQCLRIRVHKNLCVALLMNCCLYIIMNSLVGIHKMDLSVAADWFCKTLKCLNVYSSMATINWMFVEGFLFHRKLYAPFHQNTKLYLIGYYTIGWILPGVCVLAWSLSLEFASVVSHKPCWEGYRTSNAIFIVSTPMILAVGINFIFLISIIRLLVTKLRADTSQSDQATIKAIKATALLIPLLGIHHLVVLYNPSTFNRKLVNIYIVINVLFQSVQGIIVSVLYCFTNNEVKAVLNSAWSRRRMSHSTGSTLGQNGSLLVKRRKQSVGSNSFNPLNGQQLQQVNPSPTNGPLGSHLIPLNNNPESVHSNGNCEGEPRLAGSPQPAKAIFLHSPLARPNSFPSNFPQAVTDL